MAGNFASQIDLFLPSPDITYYEADITVVLDVLAQ